VYGGFGLGAGARFGAVLGRQRTIARLDDEISLEVGADWVHYDCPYVLLGPAGQRCPDGHAIFFPVALQWSFFGPAGTARRLGLFLEAGVAPFGALYGACPDGAKCDLYTHAGLRPIASLGVRWLPVRHLGLTLRVGYPTITAGVSIW